MADVVCAVCHENLGSGQELGEISCCHRFCYGCISQWALIENSCPCCKHRFSSITKKRIGSPSTFVKIGPTSPVPGTVLGIEQCREVNQRPVFEDPSFLEWIEHVACVVCGSSENEAELLLCDDCDTACHTACAGLSGIPEGDWFCAGCVARRAEQQGRRQRRRPREQQAEQQQPRARRQRVTTILISDDDDDIEIQDVEVEKEEDVDALLLDDDDDDDDDDDARQPQVQRPRRRIVNGRQREEQQSRRRGGGNLRGFIVSDSDEEVESSGGGSGDDEPAGVVRSQRSRRGNPRAPAVSNRRSTRVTTRGNRGRRGAAYGVSDSDFEEVHEAVWTGGSDTEADDDVDFIDKKASPEDPTPAGDGWRRVRRSAASQRSRRGGSTLNSSQHVIAAAAQLRAGRDRRLRGEQGAAPTASHRAVEALANNWEQIRAGTATFEGVLGGSNSNSGRTAGAREQRRSRQNRVRQSQEELEVIDLSTTTYEDPRGEQYHVQQPPRTGALSPPLLSLSAKIRADLAAAKDKGARLPPRRSAGDTRGPSSTSRPGTAHSTRNPVSTPSNAAGSGFSPTPRAAGSAAWRLPGSGSTPGSSGQRRIRTVRDAHLGVSMARQTPRASSAVDAPFSFPRPAATIPQPEQYRQRPINGDGTNSPPHLQQRLAARAAAEWGQSSRSNGGAGAAPGGGSGHQRPPWRQASRPWRQQPEHNQGQQQERKPLGPPRAPHPTPVDRSIPLCIQRSRSISAPNANDPQPGPPGGISTRNSQLPYENNSNGGEMNCSPTYSASGVTPAGGVPAPRDDDPSGRLAFNPKREAYDLVKGHVRIYLEEGALNNEQYKQVSREATHMVCNEMSHNGGKMVSDNEVAIIVDTALVGVLRGQNITGCR